MNLKYFKANLKIKSIIRALHRNVEYRSLSPLLPLTPLPLPAAYPDHFSLEL